MPEIPGSKASSHAADYAISSLLCLPTEILMMIAVAVGRAPLSAPFSRESYSIYHDHCGDPDNLRLVNKAFAHIGALAKRALSCGSRSSKHALLRIYLTQRSLDRFFAVARHDILRRSVREIDICAREFDLFDITESGFKRIMKLKAAAASSLARPLTELGDYISSDTVIRATYHGFRSACAAQARILRYLKRKETTNFVDACARFTKLATVRLSSRGTDDEAHGLGADYRPQGWKPRFEFFGVFTSALEQAGQRLGDLSISLPPSPAGIASPTSLSLACPTLLQNLPSLDIACDWRNHPPFYAGFGLDFTAWFRLLRDAINVESLLIDGNIQHCKPDTIGVGLGMVKSPILEELELAGMIVLADIIATMLLSQGPHIRFGGTLRSLGLHCV